MSKVTAAELYLHLKDGQDIVDEICYDMTPGGKRLIAGDYKKLENLSLMLDTVQEVLLSCIKPEEVDPT